ncbi:hypothetical protein ABTZ03_42015 [Kitasatospora sp. NPDC096077]|uniref:hypothetical protein n=1 Tax=Kitasatospora sp. NPDC096077 TaxID=3155544 RepID=UPI00331985A9
MKRLVLASAALVALLAPAAPAAAAPLPPTGAPAAPAVTGQPSGGDGDCMKVVFVPGRGFVKIIGPCDTAWGG